MLEAGCGHSRQAFLDSITRTHSVLPFILFLSGSFEQLKLPQDSTWGFVTAVDSDHQTFRVTVWRHIANATYSWDIREIMGFPHCVDNHSNDCQPKVT